MIALRLRLVVAVWLLLAIVYLGADVSAGGRIERDGVLGVAVELTALPRGERLPVGQYEHIWNMGMTSQWQLGWAMGVCPSSGAILTIVWVWLS